jgi:hypothetical protein
MQSREIYTAFAKYVHSYDEICLLLSVAPESHAGLFYIALGLFHRDRDVRIKTADLLERVADHEAGQHWWKALSRFEKLAYVRIKRDAEMENQSPDSTKGKSIPGIGMVAFGPGTDKRVS